MQEPFAQKFFRVLNDALDLRSSRLSTTARTFKCSLGFAMMHLQVLIVIHALLFLPVNGSVQLQSRQGRSPDPCGPLVQPQQGQPENSCVNSKIPPQPVPEPGIYACYLDKNPDVSTTPDPTSAWAQSCKTSIHDLCLTIGTNSAAMWVANADGTSCRALAWIPPLNNGALLPTSQHCMNDIMFPMLDMLSNSSNKGVNRASVNIPLGSFPSGYNRGAQIDAGYASWIIQL